MFVPYKAWDDESNTSSLSSKFDQGITFSGASSIMHDTTLKSEVKNKNVKNGVKINNKNGRVKVGVRCRPPFESEIKKSDGEFTSVISVFSSDANASLGKIQLTMSSGKHREFLYDYAFDHNSSQHEVFEKIANPILSDVLLGFNGTIFAYGQTGTGKTHTMGILESVTNQNAGIIPRSISCIFHYANQTRQQGAHINITMSFLQIYRENIQDLLSTSVMSRLGKDGQNSAMGIYEDNLCVREDPRKGFYVEGLQEYSIRTYEEAEALLNVGLECRAIAPTLMNSTSSRSHTVLTLCIEQKGDKLGASNNLKFSSLLPNLGSQPNVTQKSYVRSLRSKLLLVDLAGSERVRKTISKGTRLDEAKSINTSLSALGNVIAALAEPNATHVPYRDSKLTRLLTDSLGGTASTALIATVGPSVHNCNETLSTLQFASRCMSIKSSPIIHEEVDFASMCVRLQEEVNALKVEMTSRLHDQKMRYENMVNSLLKKVENLENKNSDSHSTRTSTIDLIMSYIADNNDNCSIWCQTAPNTFPSDQSGDIIFQNRVATATLSFIYDCLREYHKCTVMILGNCQERQLRLEGKLSGEISIASSKERTRNKERLQMQDNDPMKSSSVFNTIGSHLAPLSRLEALEYVNKLIINASKLDHSKKKKDSPMIVDSAILKSDAREYTDITEFIQVIATLNTAIIHNMSIINDILEEKDSFHDNLCADLIYQMVEKRKREEEVLNWSYILKYLLSEISDLNSQQKNISPEFDSGYNKLSPPTVKIQPINFNDNENRSVQNVSVDMNSFTGKEELSPIVQTEKTFAKKKQQKHRKSQVGRIGPRTETSFVETYDITFPRDFDQIGPPGHHDEFAPSHFARDLINDLGVTSDSEASDAMKVIDKIAAITVDQLKTMDKDVQYQILQLRQQLGMNVLEGFTMPTDNYNALDGTYDSDDDCDQFSQLDNWND